MFDNRIFLTLARAQRQVASMGKKQHSKDQLYLTRTEHASGEHRGRGKQGSVQLPYRTLPFDCCAISFRPFETPLCTADGIVFELLSTLAGIVSKDVLHILS